MFQCQQLELPGLMIFGQHNFFINLKCREEKSIFFSSKDAKELKIISKHSEFPFGYKAIVTYPIFVNISNPIFISENTENGFKKFLVKFYLTGIYELKLMSGDDIINHGVAKVSSSFL